MENSKQFVKDDLLLNFELDYDEYGIPSIKKEVTARVDGYNAKGEINVDILSGFRYMNDVVGNRFVKIGNTTDNKRQGGVVIDTVTKDNPRIIVYDGVDEPSKLFDTSTFRFIAGNLQGIIDEDFQPLGDHYMTENGLEDGKPIYGMLSDYVFLRGKIHTLQGGKIGGFSVTEENNNWFLRAGSGSNAMGLSDGEYSLFAGNSIPLNAKAWIKNTGEALFKDVTIDDGSYVKTTTLKDVEGIPFVNLSFESQIAGIISWNVGSITYQGVKYNISAGNTVTGQKYITWVIGSSTLTKHNTIPIINDTNFLLAYLTSTNELVSSSFLNIIYADVINVASLSAISANIGTITAGDITGVNIKSSTSSRKIELSNGDELNYYANSNKSYSNSVEYDGTLKHFKLIDHNKTTPRVFLRYLNPLAFETFGQLQLDSNVIIYNNAQVDNNLHVGGDISTDNDLVVGGNLSASFIQPTSGYKSVDGTASTSGSFTSADGKSITVKNGIITHIVIT